MKEALVTLRVPLRDDYPWKPAQRPIKEVVLNGAVDGIRWLDCVSGMIEAQICVVDVPEAVKP